MRLDNFSVFKRRKINENIDIYFDEDLKELPDESQPERDSITLSKKLTNRLKELKIDTDKKISIGDKVVVKDLKQGKLSDKVFDYLKSREIFEVLKINKQGKLDIGYAQRYIRESDGKKIKKVFYFSTRRFEKMDKYDNVALFFLELKDIEKDKLLPNPLDFIDIDDKGNFSFISRRVHDGGDPFKSNKRQVTNKISRMLNRIVTKDYYESKIKPKDIEIFMNKWRVLFDDSYTLRVLEGDEILDAYNSKKIAQGFSFSCANFEGKRPANKFNVYTENPENIKCLVVYHKGKIHGRRMLFTGIQSKTHGKFKKDQQVTLLNHAYCVGGRGSKIDQMMTRWANDNDAYLLGNLGTRDNIIRMKIQNTKYKVYPPWDSMVVNFETDEIASSRPNDENGWTSAYEASYRK